jgi:hypothetical protein
MEKVTYKVICERPFGKAETLALFKSKDRELFISYLAEKKVGMVMARGQSASSEAEYRLGAIEAVDSIMRELSSLDSRLKSALQSEHDKRKAKAEAADAVDHDGRSE